MTATTDADIALHTDENESDYKFFVGVRNDIRRRLNPASWLSDWCDGTRWQVVNASFFMFFASIAPPLAFAQTLMNRTGGEMGLVELVVSTAVCGAIFAICAGQPLNIVGVTGPTIILYGAMHGVTESLGAPFLPFMGWACVWAALILASLALSGGAALARTVTRFTDEIFGGLIALVYLSVAVEGLARQFTHIGTVEPGSDEPESTLAGALLSLLLAGATAAMCHSLHAARRWRIAHPAVRDLLARYNTCLALLLFTATSYWGSLRGAHVERLHSIVHPGMWDGRPTHARGAGEGEGAGRAWFVPLLAGGIGAGEILLALVPGVLMVFLLFFDHSVVALVSAAPEFRLRKGSSFHWDTLLLALTVLLCGLLGLPPVNGVLPQSPMHVQACAIVRRGGKKTSMGRGENAEEGSEEEHEQREHEITGVHENRVSPLLQSLLCALVLAVLPGVREIPIAVLWGLFLYFGATSFYGNQLAERAASFALHRDELARLRREHDADADAAGGGGRGHIVGPPRRVVAWFTAAQLACLAAVYYVSEHAPDDKARAAFAVLIILLVPLRALVLPRFFAAEHLAQLDGHGEREHAHANGDGEGSCRLSLAGDREGDCDDFGLHSRSTRSSMRPSASAGLLLAYPSRSSVRTAYAYTYASSTHDSSTSATRSRPARVRVATPAANARGGSGLQTAETLQMVSGMTPGSTPPSSRSRSEEAARDKFKAQHGEMILRMRRHEAQPDVAGFRSRKGLLNKRHPLHARCLPGGDSEQQDGWSRRMARA